MSGAAKSKPAPDQGATTEQPVFTLIRGGSLYTPDPAGEQSLLLVNGRIARIGPVDERQLAATGLPCEVIDATGCVVTPGFLDPHQHLIGAGGEQGWVSRNPEVSFEELLRAGTTTVVGLLGTGTVTRKGEALLGKVRELAAKGLSAYMLTGGFPIPPPTIAGSIQRDMVLIPEVIGLGEVAIADNRSVEPTPLELARVVAETYLGGLITGKCGVTIFHTGPGKSYLKLLHDILDQHDTPPECVYPTHITRSEELLADAIRLAKRGCFVDMDTTEPGLAGWISRYWEGGGPPDRLTASSDAHTQGTNLYLFREITAAVRDEKLPLERVLPIVTRNTAAALKLPSKGELRPDADGDVLVLRRDSLEIVHVLAGGRPLLRDGEIVAQGAS